MAEYDYDLGSHSWPVTTGSREAQAWFDRGLVWCYGFNHEEGLACFRRAADADPACAMAYWGQAYAIGPNYNKDWDAFHEQELVDAVGVAHAAIGRARQLAGSASPVEQSLIDALAARYPEPVPPEDCASWSDAYAAVMRDAYRRHGSEPDVAALFAEALMNRTPWLLWNLDTGEPAEGADTAEAVDVLERAMAATERPHPGLLHLYVHAIEMSPDPERALPGGGSAPRPGAGLPVTCATCRRTSTSSAGATATWSPSTRRRSRPTASSWSGRARSTSTRCTAATTITSRSTGRCSRGASNPPWRLRTSWRRRSAATSSGSRCRRWRTGPRRSYRPGCTCWCDSGSGGG